MLSLKSLHIDLVHGPFDPQKYIFKDIDVCF